MGLLNPLALAGLVAVPIILVLHMLRQHRREVVWPSLLLWQQAASKTQISHSRLNINLLLLLQILAAVLVVLAMARPFLSGAVSGSHIIVLDASLSMQAETVSGGPSRFELAQEMAGEIVLGSGGAVTLIVADGSPHIAYSIEAGESRVPMLAAIQEAGPGYALFDEAAVAGLVLVAREINDAPAIILTDRPREISADNVYSNIITYSIPNMAIISLTHANDTDRTIALVRVRNFADISQANSVEVFVDDVLVESRQFSLAPEEEVDFFFFSLPGDVQRIEARLAQRDAFPIDDIAYSVAATAENSRALLVSHGNVFLESALRLLPQLELVVAGPEDAGLQGFGLYIFDGILPEYIPNDGHLIIINPPQGNNFIDATPANISAVNTVAGPITRFIEGLQFALSHGNVLEHQSWATQVLSSPQGALMLAGQMGTQRIVIIGFDLLDSDLPLRMEFPILIHNIVEFALPPGVAATPSLNVGEYARLLLMPQAEAAHIVTPDNSVYEISLETPLFAQTSLPGFYIVEQLAQNQRSFASFAVNAPREASELRSFEDWPEAGYMPIGVADRQLSIWMILATLIVLSIEWVLYVRRRGFRGLFRAGTALLLVISLANPGINLAAQGTDTVFVLDISDSAGGTVALAKIQAAVAEAGEDDRVGIVAFAREAFVEMPLAAAQFPQQISTVAYTGQTNIEQALHLASSMLVEGGRIVLVSDGIETAGDALAQAPMLRRRGISFAAAMLPAVEYEAQLSELRLPGSLRIGAHFELEIVAHSTVAQDARLLLYRNNSLIHSRDVALSQGESRFAIADVAEQAGSMTYRAELIAQRDTFHQNNILFAHSLVEGLPRVLVVEGMGQPAPGENIARMLNAASVEVSRAAAISAPNSLAALRGYDAIILADVSLEHTPEGFDALLEVYVRTGGGLLAVGGQQSFALGAYRGTPLEQALPVEMVISDTAEEGSVAMLVVLDRSGSMMDGRFGLTYMELAKEATIRAVETLSDQDYFGTIVFDHESEWASYLRPVQGNRAAMIHEIGSITPGGGTSILPALRMAYESISTADISPQFRHILLLTDGIAEQYGYEPVIGAMLEAGVTLSTIAFGGEADTELLIELADMGQGRYYFVDEFTDLPRIFAAETQMAGRSFLNNEAFFPVAGAENEILREIYELPQLGGHVSTSLRPLANIVLAEPERGEPILATWQYGLGRAAVFTSDLAGLWSAQWLASEQGTAVFYNTLTYIARVNTERNFLLSASPLGEGALVRLSVPPSESLLGVQLGLVGENGQINTELRPTAPGVFEGFLEKGQGAYTAVLSFYNMGGENEVITTGLNIPFGAEYDIRLRPSGAALMANLAAATGGQLVGLEGLGGVFQMETTGVFTNFELGNLLLALALVLLITEIAFRRFNGIIIRKPQHQLRGRAQKLPDKPTQMWVQSRVRQESVSTSTSASLIAGKHMRGR